MATLAAIGLLSAVVSAGAQPAPAQPDPDKRAAAGAIGAFAFGCLERIRFSATAEAYAAGTDQLAAEIKSQTSGAALPFSIEGVNGDTCRVAYHGPQAAFLWTTLSDFSRNRKNAPCTDGPATPDHASIVCPGTKTSPAYEERIERDGDRFTASVTWKGPGLP